MTYYPYNRVALASELRRDEALRHRLYNDRDGKEYKSDWGKLTIGIGWNIEDKGLPEAVIEVLLDRGIDEAEETLDRIEPRWRLLSVNDQARARALLNMAFNLGEHRLRDFKKMWAALGNFFATGNADWWAEAAKEALDSTWARQVGLRAQRIATVFRTGALG